MIFLIRPHRVALILVAVFAFACAGPSSMPVPVSLREMPAAKRILILKSNDNPQFDLVIDNFAAQVPAAVQLLSLADTPEESVTRYLREKPPPLVVTLGSRATTLVRSQFPAQPLLFMMVVSYQRLKLGDPTTLTGIALELPPALELAQFRIVSGTLKKIVAFYNPSATAALVKEAAAAAENLGMRLMPVPVGSLDDIRDVFASSTRDADAVWLLPDSVAVNPSAFEFLRAECLRTKKALLASFSEKFAEAGALMALRVDLSSMGAQAAAIAADVLQGERRLANIGIVPPISGRLFVNKQVADTIRLAIPDDALPYFEYSRRKKE